jgi:hypothetical protein
MRKTNVVHLEKRTLDIADLAIAKFLKMEIDTQASLQPLLDLPPDAPVADHVWTLQSALFGRGNSISKVYIRACYKIQLKRVMEAFGTPNGGILLMGTRGTGKSVFGLLVVLELVRLRKPVIYQHHLGRVLIVSDPLPQEAAAIVANHHFQAVTEPGVYNLSDVDLFKSLYGLACVYYVQDLGDSEEQNAIANGQGRWLVVSSPNSGKLKSLRNNAWMKRLVMPLWTLQELQNARATVYEGLPPLVYAGYTPVEVAERFTLYGGVPRWVLERPRVGDESFLTSEEELQTSLANVTMEELSNVFRAATYMDIPKQNLTSILVHIVPGQTMGDRPRCAFASEAIRGLLVEAFLDRQNFGVAGFINAVSVVPELGGYRGYSLEYNVHRSMRKGPLVKLRLLGARSDSSKFVVVQFPILTLPAVRFSDKMLSDFAAIQELQYVYPLSKIFPTVDGWVILPYSLFVKDGKGMCLVFIQSTVSNSHKVDGSVLSRVLGKVRDLRNDATLPAVLVFATDSNGIATAQTVRNSEDKEYANKKTFPAAIQQFAMWLGQDFDTLAKFERERQLPTVTTGA